MRISYKCPGENFVYLITDIDQLPELEQKPANECKIIFRMVPCAVLQKGGHLIACATSIRAPLRVVAQILEAAPERENQYGYAFVARVLEIPEYVYQVHYDPMLSLPYSVASAAFPELRSESTDEHPVSADEIVQIMFERDGVLPMDPIYRNSIINLSVNIAEKNGGLALNGNAPFLNSRSHPDHIRIYEREATVKVWRPGCCPNHHYRLSGVQTTLPVTSPLPLKRQDDLAMIDPAAAIIARMCPG